MKCTLIYKQTNNHLSESESQQDPPASKDNDVASKVVFMLTNLKFTYISLVK